MAEAGTPDTTQQDLAQQIDDLVPSYGYAKVPVVGLGGSAGSIEALQAFFGTMPLQSQLAFVVVIHLSPGHDSVLSEVLQRCTNMPVIRVHHELAVEAGKVYVIPPACMLQWVDGRLRVLEGRRDGARQTAVDVFFRSLADSHGPHAAAVVLSGMDGDGAVGIRRIKERGGLTIAQDPEEAAHAGMPRHAVDTGMVDWVLPVRDMPQRLLAYFRLEKALDLPPEQPEEVPPDVDAELRDVLGFVRTRTGRDFSNYKRATVLRRVARRMQVNGVDNLPAYLNVLRTRGGECASLVQDLLISVTNFFRDPDYFEALRQQVPALFEGKGPDNALRVWVMACATGEEAYSIAMLLSEYARGLEAPPAIQLFATDLDGSAIQAARDGLYPHAIAADVSDERLRRFFTHEHRGWRVRRELRELVLFAVHDVLKHPPFSHIDLLSCRNLLIYLTREAQARVLRTAHFALVPGGKLFLGASESAEDHGKLFKVVDKKHRIFAQRPAPRGGMPLPGAGGMLQMTVPAQQALREGTVISTLAATLKGPPGLRGADGLARPASWGELHLRLLELVGPPSVLVDSSYEIVHLSPTAGRFLQLAGGEPSRNLLHSVQPALRIELRAALYRASQTNAPAEAPAVRLEVGGTPMTVAPHVVPLREADYDLFLVLFRSQAGEAPEGSVAPHADPLARQLDREIDRLKSQLRDTVEQYETSTEELKASNEELQAMNEELRAATEELETSREELQSINEELTTVNHELKGNVDQLSTANSDLQNLMDATAIATIFLDRDLRIMRYTPAAVDLFNLIPGDIGRPLTDMANQVDYPGLGADAQRVLERLVPVEREVGRNGDSWFLARLMPYRTMDDRIAGVVVTLVDITERKRAEELRLWLSAVVNSSTDAIVSFSLDATILSWNGGAERLFGYTAAEAIGRPLAMLAPGREAEQQRLLAEVAAGRNVEYLESVRRRADGSDVHVAVSASPIRDTSGGIVAGTAMVRDITAQRAAAEALRTSEERLRMLVDHAVDYAIFSTDLQRQVTLWNTGAERLLGYAQQEVVGRPADFIFTPEDRAAGAPEAEARTALENGRATDDRLHLRKDGSRFQGSGVMMVMRDPAGEPAGFVKILRDLTA
ncbi:MAG: PAS domain S-box protein [Burkholderiales bacterium]|nr:PAS domain S-box protein [Burkholderiales bacterium]